jgi:Uncharacterized proteins, homologs of microcin C7 resistance protein MccF
MLKLMKPKKLKRGDKIATVSLSWGGAGDPAVRWRYEQGKERLKNVFGLDVVEMPHTLKSPEFVYNHPEARAEDLMQAFADPSIKAIISCIGGNDSIRLLPYIDFDIIRDHPKIYTGYSDSTITHFMCLKAGLSSFYGLSVLNDLAENVAMPEYTVQAAKKVLFEAQEIGAVAVSPVWTGKRLEWAAGNKDVARKFEKNTGYELLQGHGTARGRLIGGCLDVIEMIKGTSLFPDIRSFDRSILFLETSEECPPPWFVEDFLRGFGSMGIIGKLNGIIFGKPYQMRCYDAYKEMIRKTLKEFGREHLPVLYNASFGHNEPKCLIPYGALAEIDCEKPGFSILESGVE